ncbi:MAG: (2Fe-2S) ferredoxin domain-containing protein [Candidatus Hydrogenedentes bacterium]|nr:(2Fe-2S) ferredoxin domain-containing protein [Candidatus Hydrogenedentota bacterium]
MEENDLPYDKIIFVCTNRRQPGDRVCCASGGSEDLHATLKSLIERRGLRRNVRVSRSGCMDRCESGPNIMVFPDNIWYSDVEEDELGDIVDAIERSLKQEPEFE